MIGVIISYIHQNQQATNTELWYKDGDKIVGKILLDGKIISGTDDEYKSLDDAYHHGNRSYSQSTFVKGEKLENLLGKTEIPKELHYNYVPEDRAENFME